ncbi:unnamed protein product [Zymoseptoria tritici ST99CH_1A5]|uniref:WSC domain-containing protein n=2 Tax=Zymoseptoria tritici TaxID=1047171 RepID=A0A2H1H0I5_ZYMTR|nr:unnamed protein product [Zymoseptoria tritici ST99CH_1E4]SMR63169.1 unnamed protein product [Zymoseptoria tritici ST99CH_3D1]SMY28550.1 unnamed protein product [Zymoseptoria tritici ST99CH_1A5]
MLFKTTVIIALITAARAADPLPIEGTCNGPSATSEKGDCNGMVGGTSYSLPCSRDHCGHYPQIGDHGPVQSGPCLQRCDHILRLGTVPKERRLATGNGFDFLQAPTRHEMAKERRRGIGNRVHI